MVIDILRRSTEEIDAINFQYVPHCYYIAFIFQLLFFIITFSRFPPWSQLFAEIGIDRSPVDMISDS